MNAIGATVVICMPKVVEHRNALRELGEFSWPAKFLEMDG